MKAMLSSVPTPQPTPLAGVMLLALFLAMRVRVVTAAILTVVIVPAVYHVFAVQLGVPLPWGWLGG